MVVMFDVLFGHKERSVYFWKETFANLSINLVFESYILLRLKSICISRR